MNEKSGFTLIELILVTVIIGILAGMVTLSFAGRAEKVSRKAAKGDITTYGSAIDLFALDHSGQYPKTLQELAPTYIRNLNRDPWGNEYVYECPGSVHKESYDVYSAGPDGVKGNEDDVTEISG